VPEALDRYLKKCCVCAKTKLNFGWLFWSRKYAILTVRTRRTDF